MKSLINEQITEIEIKKSKFICHLKNVSSEQEARDYIANLKTIHPTAAHHCSAYRVNNIERANDDGEPSQTAGMPMLNVLIHNQLINTVAVVVRYFGGVKLGAGGLVRAYTDSVVSALAEADVAELVEGYQIQINAGYSDIDKINYILKSNDLNDFVVVYGSTVEYKLELSISKFPIIETALKTFNHKINVEIINRINVVDN